MEIVHWYYTNDIGIGKIKRQAEREGGHILILPSPAEEEAGALSGRTNGFSSDSKVTKDSENNNTSLAKSIETARQETDTAPTEAQAAAGNYKKGHVKIDGFDISLENPKGSVRRGIDASGKEWQTEMHNDYGYLRRTEGVDGDHIDVFLSDTPEQGNVYVIDQIRPETGEFDEHKVMYGFNSEEEARDAYLSNYKEGWKGLGGITPVSKEEFKKWVDSSHRKTKPFAEYASVKPLQVSGNITSVGNEDFGPIYDQFRGKAKDAIEFLLAQKNGEAIGALHHKDIGYIDLVWGVEGTEHSNGYGLAKVVKYHPEVLGNLQDIIDDMDVITRSENRIQLESDKYQASVRLTWNNIKKTWLLTAFEKKNSVSDNTTDTVGTLVEGKKNDKATLQNTASVDKVTKDSEKTKASEEKQLITGKEDKKYQQEKAIAEKGYAEALEAQGYLSAAPKKLSKINIEKYAKKVKKDKPLSALNGVFHDKGLEVASDSHILIARKAAYDKSLEGKSTLKGEVINARFPSWRDLFNVEPTPESIDFERLSGFIQAAKADERYAKGFKDGMRIGIRLSNGEVTYYRADLLEKFVDFARSIEGKPMSSKFAKEYGASRLQAKNGEQVALLMPIVGGKISEYKDIIFQTAEEEASAKERKLGKALSEEPAQPVDEVKLSDEPMNESNAGGTLEYKTQDGTSVICRSLLGEMKATEEVKQETALNGDVNLSELRMRKLKKNETCHVERVYEETKQFDFTGKDKVESAEDVAYIFRQLENAAVENSFLVLVKDGKPTVIHLGVGSYNTTVAPYEQAFVAYKALNPEQVYFVHNHPSGTLKASRQDRDMLSRVKQAFGEDVVQQGIIIDTTSGNYGEFDIVNADNEMPKAKGQMPTGEVPIKVYKFSKQVFAPDWNPETSFKITSSNDVAKFVSSHRLGEHKKMSFLVVSSSGNVVANVFLPWTKLSQIKYGKDAGDLLAGYVYQCGGASGILYGNYAYTLDDGAILRALQERMKQLNVSLLDALYVEHSVFDNGIIGEPDNAIYKGKLIPLSQRFDENNDDARFQIADNEMSDEEKLIAENAKADGTYMKAPNGRPTNLNERQWVQVRTEAFKKWFGDWEKAARIEKLRKSEPVVISGNEYKGKYDFNRDSVKAWIKDSLRGEYTISDTKEKVVLTRAGANKVTSHGMSNNAHLQSIVAIPELIRNAMFIEERPNEKNNDKYDSYRYYVCGLKIGTTNYTVKMTIGVKSGKKYYDHALTEIEKGKLLDRINDQAEKTGFTTTGGAPLQSYASSASKDSKLLSILQTNASKVIDENGEPLVVYHGTNVDFTQFDTAKIGGSTGTSDGRGFYFTTDKNYADSFSTNGNVVSVFLNINNPLSLEKKTITKRQLFDIIKRIDEKEFAADGEHWFVSNYGNYYDMGIDGVIKEAVENEYPYSDNDVELVNSLISASGNFKVVANSVYEVTGKSSEIVPKENGTIHYVVTNPNQIKSAAYNNGDFSMDNTDIRYREEEKQFNDEHATLADMKDMAIAKRLKEGHIDKNNYSDYVFGTGLNPLRRLIGRNGWTAPYRTVFKTPTLDDYYIGTKAVFEPVALLHPGDNEEKYNETMSLWSKMKESGDFHYHKSPLSNSEYLIDTNSGDIYRMSDHWGRVASCQWELDEDPDNPSALAIAKANISDFSPDYTSGGYVADNPVVREGYHDALLQTIANYEGVLNDKELSLSPYARRKFEDALESFKELRERYEANGYSDVSMRDIMFKEAKTSNGVNKKFDEELLQQIDGTLPAGHVYQLGHPGAILRAAGFPDAPIEMSATHFAEKAAQRGHGYELSDMFGLVDALNNPLAVFAYGDSAKAQNVIVEIEREGKNFVIGVHFNQLRDGIEVSSIRGLFPKKNAEWLNWIAQGKTLYMDKARIQVLIDQQRTNLADVDYLDLDSVTNVIEKFENPNISSENVQEENDSRAKQERAGTILGRKGLRSIVGDYNFNRFLDKVFRGADEKTRRRIANLAIQKGWDFHLATDEHIAQLAEFGFADRLKRTFWGKVRAFFLDTRFVF